MKLSNATLTNENYILADKVQPKKLSNESFRYQKDLYRKYLSAMAKNSSKLPFSLSNFEAKQILNKLSQIKQLHKDIFKEDIHSYTTTGRVLRLIAKQRFEPSTKLTGTFKALDQSLPSNYSKREQFIYNFISRALKIYQSKLVKIRDFVSSNSNLKDDDYQGKLMDLVLEFSNKITESIDSGEKGATYQLMKNLLADNKQLILNNPVESTSSLPRGHSHLLKIYEDKKGNIVLDYKDYELSERDNFSIKNKNNKNQFSKNLFIDMKLILNPNGDIKIAVNQSKLGFVSDLNTIYSVGKNLLKYIAQFQFLDTFCGNYTEPSFINPKTDYRFSNLSQIKKDGSRVDTNTFFEKLPDSIYQSIENAIK